MQLFSFVVNALLALGSHDGSTAVKNTLTLEGAKRVVAAAVADAKKKSNTGVVAVVDDGGALMCLERLDGTFSAGAEVSIGKAQTAATFKKPTRVFEEIVNKGRTAFVTAPHFTPLQGGVPIVVDGQIVGAIGVSGAASAAQDEEIARAGAAALVKATDGAVEAHAVPTTYFERDRVDAAFSKSAVLYAGENANFQVHASRRESAGQAEVHTSETDVIYVLEGGATLVTGGTVVGGKATAPNEQRGVSIEGGETRRIVAGDVIIVPAGVPHWFKDVPSPIRYYVVKVRS